MLQSLIRYQQTDKEPTGFELDSVNVTEYGHQLFHDFCKHSDRKNISIQVKSIPIQLYHALFYEENESDKNEPMISFLPILKTFALLQNLTLRGLPMSDLLINIEMYINAIINLIDKSQDILMVNLQQINLETTKPSS